MEIYVDKKPKCCKDCPCRASDDDGIIRICQLENNEGLYLVLTDEMWSKKRPKQFPLKLLRDKIKASYREGLLQKQFDKDMEQNLKGNLMR